MILDTCVNDNNYTFNTTAPVSLGSIDVTPRNLAGTVGADVVLPCRSSDGQLDWAVSHDRGKTWIDISRGEKVNNPHYNIISTEAGEYNLQILDLTLQDGALYKCLHWFKSEYAYVNLVVMCEYMFRSLFPQHANN